jgi:hypothetical protein
MRKIKIGLIYLRYYVLTFYYRLLCKYYVLKARAIAGYYSLGYDIAIRGAKMLPRAKPGSLKEKLAYRMLFNPIVSKYQKVYFLYRKPEGRKPKFINDKLTWEE